MAVRFATPSLEAFLAVEGLDTASFGIVVQWYDLLGPAAVSIMMIVMVLVWPGGFGRGPLILCTAVLSAADVVLWLGEMDPVYRLVQGPWAILPLGFAATATILLCGIALERRLQDGSFRGLRRDGFRALYGGFGFAYLLGTLRFIDYRYATGVALPSGVVWLLDYGPVLLLSLESVYFWARVCVPDGGRRKGVLQSLILSLMGVVAGVGVAQGFGGFILSNALAWGGAYEVFTPTGVSLGFVGLAAGCFLATAWTLRGRVSRTSWRFVVAGVSTAALAGILAFAGTLGSLAGILLGLFFVARGFARPVNAAAPRPTMHEPTTLVAEYRE